MNVEPIRTVSERINEIRNLTLRLADGPDKIVTAKNILRRYHSGRSWDLEN